MLLSILLGFIGPWQVVLIVAIVLLLFGGRKIPELMRGLGKGMKEFKDATKEDDENSTQDSISEKGEKS
jgi:sec-independent protein translocase protein TatA